MVYKYVEYLVVIRHVAIEQIVALENVKALADLQAASVTEPEVKRRSRLTFCNVGRVLQFNAKT